MRIAAAALLGVVALVGGPTGMAGATLAPRTCDAVPAWPKPTESNLLNTDKAASSTAGAAATFFSRRLLDFPALASGVSPSGVAWWDLSAAGLANSGLFAPGSSSTDPSENKDNDDVLAWRVYAERGSHDGVTPPSLSLASFSQSSADGYSFAYDAQGFVSGNLASGQWETMQTLSFLNVIEFLDADGDGVFTPNSNDTIISQADLAALAWDRPCASNGAPSRRYGSFSLRSRPLAASGAGMVFQATLETSGGAAGVTGPSSDKTVGAQGLQLSARNLRFALSVMNYPYLRLDTMLALNASLVQSRGPHTVNSTTTSTATVTEKGNIDLTGASGVGGSKLNASWPLAMADANILVSRGADGARGFDAAYLVWNPTWTTAVSGNGSSATALIQTNTTLSSLRTFNVSSALELAEMLGNGDAAGMFLANYTMTPANGSGPPVETQVQHGNIAVSQFILSFSVSPAASSDPHAPRPSPAQLAAMRASLSASFSLGLGPVPLPGGRGSGSKGINKLVWILVGSAGGVLLVIAVMWVCCKRKKRQERQEGEGEGHYQHFPEHGGEQHHTDEQHVVAAGGLNAHPFSPRGAPSRVRSPDSPSGRKNASAAAQAQRAAQHEALLIRGGAGAATSTGQVWGGAVMSDAHSYTPSGSVVVAPGAGLAPREQPAPSMIL